MVQLESLGGQGRDLRIVDFALAAFALIGPIAIFMGHRPFETEMVNVFVSVLVGAVAFGVIMLIKELLVATILAGKIRRINHGFNASEYLEQLAEKRDHGVLVIAMTFSRPWPEGDRESAAKAISGWAQKMGPGAWSDDGTTLSARSEEIDCKGSVWSRGGSVRFFTNRDVNDVFLELVKRAVPALNDVVPITHLRAEIEGHVHRIDMPA
jgi:hypothetical protein